MERYTSYEWRVHPWLLCHGIAYVTRMQKKRVSTPVVLHVHHSPTRVSYMWQRSMYLCYAHADDVNLMHVVASPAFFVIILPAPILAPASTPKPTPTSTLETTPTTNHSIHIQTHVCTCNCISTHTQNCTCNCTRTHRHTKTYICICTLHLHFAPALARLVLRTSR